MTTTKIQDTTLAITKTLKAPVDKVYKTWTEPEHIAKWFGCGKTAEVKIAQDLRVGGDFRIEMLCTDGEVAVVNGTYKEIIENKKIVYTWSNNSDEFPAADTLVTVEFVAKGELTELVLKHENFKQPVSAQGHTMGWGAALDKLEALFDSAK